MSKLSSILGVVSFVLAVSGVSAQELRTVYTMDDAKKFIEKNQSLNPEIITVTSSDTSQVTQSILKRRKGDFFVIGKFAYKALDEKSSSRYRARYIFLDGFDLDQAKLEATRKLIADEIKAGKSFQELSDKYGMDGNTTGGDTGWFDEEAMVPEFVQAVKNHKKDEVFYVDLPERNWYYVVLKTHDDDRTSEMQVLRTKK